MWTATPIPQCNQLARTSFAPQSAVVVTMSDGNSTITYDSTDAWSTAPACKGNITTDYSSYDNNGRLWGWENNTSCVWKDGEAKPVDSADVRGLDSSLLLDGWVDAMQ